MAASIGEFAVDEDSDEEGLLPGAEDGNEQVSATPSGLRHGPQHSSELSRPGDDGTQSRLGGC